MTTPWRRLAWTLVLVTLGSLWLARDAAAYWGVTTLDYGGQLTGYARVEKEAWDPDSELVCTEEGTHPWYGPWCFEGFEYVYSVGLEHELRTPTGALHASGASSAPWTLQLNLVPHTPTVYGTWTHHGVYHTVWHEYLYVWNESAQDYDVSYEGDSWHQFGGHSPQVNVPEPSPPPLLVHYVHTDALGSVRLMTDAAGQPVTACNYVPFGQDWQSTGDVAECRFAQTERSPDTGAGSWQDLNYAGARYYHSQTWRFTSVDPGHVGMNLLDPQSWNGYAYAGNNPLRYVDPTGTDYLIHGYAVQPGIFEGSYSDLKSAVEGMGSRLDGNSFRGVILGIDSNEAIAFYQQIGIGPGPGAAMPGAPPGRGPGPPGGGGSTQDQPGLPICSSVPLKPPRADLEANIAAATNSRRLVFALPRLRWFNQQVRNGGPWDYKQGSSLESSYEPFGNFNYGVTGAAAGIQLQILRRTAGWAQSKAGTSAPGWGSWYDLNLSGPYGDDPRDQDMIVKGFEYYTAGCWR